MPVEKTILPAKPHYPLLDGLRGIAALIVVAFHLMEAHATSHYNQLINHGYLAVDFFFLLSGFVIGYAYDDRWNKLTIGAFFKRRLIRLQPMVIAGMVTGAALYYFQQSGLWPRIAQTPPLKVLWVMLLGCIMIPLPKQADLRGWDETYPLDGPAWSLFFEYLVNVLYAVLLRRLPAAVLGVLTALAACLLVQVACTQGDVVGGWSLDAKQLHIGFARVLFPFLAGLLLFRLGKRLNVKNAFLWSSLLLAAILCFPRVGNAQSNWLNGLYESVCILVLFPVVILMAVSSGTASAFTGKACKFLGDLSYPLYITHYPLIYTYTAWVYNHKVSVGKGLPVALAVMVTTVVLAYAFLRLYDIPVRKWLAGRSARRKALRS